MTRRILLAAVTGDAAVILGEGDRLGTLEAGKDADRVLWKEQPSSPWGRLSG